MRVRVIGSLIGLALVGCATHQNLAANAAPPVSIVVTAAPGVDAGAAERMRSIMEDAIRRNVRDGQPLLISISLTPRTASRSYPGMNVNRQGPTFLQITQLDYALTDVDGFVLDARSIAIPTAEAGYSRLSPMHVAADSIAARISSLHH